MNGFEYIRKSNTMFQPKTPAAALKAISMGILPDAAFIYKATSVKPLYEEPFDLVEIERVLAQKNRDIKTNLLLMKILKTLIRDKDPETALFAAESINTIETGYNNTIESLKLKLKEKEDAPLLREIAGQFYELALLNENQKTLKNFYLKESFSYLRKIEKTGTLSEDDNISMIKILLDLELYFQAKQIAEQVIKTNKNPEFLIMEAEIEFYRKDFLKVFNIFLKLGDRKNLLDIEELKILSYWTGI